MIAGRPAGRRAGGRRELTEEHWEPFARTLSFAPASAEQPDALLEAVARAEQELGAGARRLIYLAVPPDTFAPMVRMLGACGLTKGAKLIIEKPFGNDLTSACALNKTMHSVLEESQIFRIDHFLGKEAVQNILAFRFGNGLFESVWNREHVEHVQIDVPEQLTIEGREGFDLAQVLHCDGVAPAFNAVIAGRLCEGRGSRDMAQPETPVGQPVRPGRLGDDLDP